MHVSKFSFAFLFALLFALALMPLSASVLAAEITVLSAGAIEPGLKAAAAAFEKQTGHVAKITFNTAPELKKKMQANPAFDVVIAPPAVLGEFAGAGQLGDARARVGRVGLTQPALAQQFVVFLSGPVGKPAFVAAGVTD